MGRVEASGVLAVHPPRFGGPKWRDQRADAQSWARAIRSRYQRALLLGMRLWLGKST